MRGARRRELVRILAWVVAGLAGSGFVFLVSYRFVLHHFMTGPFLWDVGWFSSAIFRNGFVLPTLPSLRQARGDSLFTQHVYGAVSLASPASHLFSTHYHYFATVIGLTYATSFLGPFLTVMALRGRPQRSAAFACVAFAAGIAFAFSGPVVSAMGYPHFETAIPSLFLVFLALHFLGRSRAKWVALCVGAIVREDAGLHYAWYFALIALYQWWSHREPIPRRTLLGAAALSVAIAVTMLAGQRLFFPFGDSMFYKSFVGTPAFAHVSAVELRARAVAFLVAAPHLYVPMAVVGVAALLLRAPAYALGYAACVPWVVLNVAFSLTPAAKTLSLYYGFPLLVGLAWPLVAPHWMRGAPRPRDGQLALATFFVAAIVSLALLKGHAFVRADALAGGDIPAATFARASRCLEAAFRAEPRLYADSSILAMFPGSVPAARVLDTKDEVAAVPAEGFVFYDNDMAPVYLARARALGLGYVTSLPAPRIHVLSRDPSAFSACLGLGGSAR